MYRPTLVNIYLDNVVNNAKLLKSFAGPQSFFCPMIKALAYGHGDIQVANALDRAGFKTVGVALVEEGVRVRQGGFTGEILVFGPLSAQPGAVLDEFSLTPVLNRWADLESLRAGTPRKVHLKFNTGMHRLGFAMDEANKVKERLLGSRLKVVGVCSHLSHGDDGENANGQTRAQLKRLQEIATHFPGVILHCLNSSGLLSLKAANFSDLKNWGVRPGIALYGLPSGQEVLEPGLKPVLEWKTKVVALQKVAKGQAVSYGGRWTAKVDSVIGIVPIGYADGYMRCHSNISEMLVCGQRAKVVGSVCMDYTLLDLTNAVDLCASLLYEEVVVIGQQGAQTITAGELAQNANTISYEIVTNISARNPRVFLEAN